MKRLQRLPPRRRGAAAVEFALCVPILLVTMFAIVEFSRALQIQQAVRQAAFEGARAGLALDAVTSDATTAASNVVTAVGIRNATITVTPNPLTYTTTTIGVTVSVSPSTNTWFMRFFAGSQPISATITLNREVQAISNP